MKTSTPLLIPSNLNPHTTRQDIPTKSSSSDELIELSLGSFGCMQLLQSILICLVSFFDAQQTLISVFTDAEPSWHCTNPTACNSTSNVCDLPATAWSWDGPPHQSIVSEWRLQCESSFITGLPASSYFLGCFVGGFVFAALGDSTLGRKNLITLSCLAMSITGFTTAFANNIWVYSGLRFITGCFRSSILTSLMVLLMEKVGKHKRGLVSSFFFIFFSLGELSLPTIAYLNRQSSWRILYVWTSVPAILYSGIAYFTVSESPRWLFVHGRQVEALKVLKSLSLQTDESLEEYSKYCFTNPIVFQRISVCSSIKNLTKRRWAIKRLLLNMGVGFGIGMAYYGLLLGVENLNLSSYISVSFNGLIGFGAYLLSFFLIEKWNRKTSILSCCVSSGFFSILICVATSRSEVLQLVSELASLLTVCAAFNVMLVQATELFPTTVRNLATSMVRQALNFGALLSPVLISAGKKNVIWCYGVLGVVVLCCGFFVIWLPETKGVALSDTLDEEEEKEVTP